MSFPGAVASKVELDQAQNLRGVSRGILENSPHLPDDKCAIEIRRSPTDTPIARHGSLRIETGVPEQHSPAGVVSS
jgi:hypothetical protein